MMLSALQAPTADSPAHTLQKGPGQTEQAATTAAVITHAAQDCVRLGTVLNASGFSNTRHASTLCGGHF